MAARGATPAALEVRRGLRRGLLAPAIERVARLGYRERDARAADMRRPGGDRHLRRHADRLALAVTANPAVAKFLRFGTGCVHPQARPRMIHQLTRKQTGAWRGTR